ncbi:MAG: ATP synthase F0 subunit A [Bacteroidetes bacterium]|nr:MAG: ATP synthase F0 subunit A [Bacteroidota bacterium]
MCVLSLFFFSTALANEEPTDSHEKFDAGKLILEHISDAHDWHLWDWAGHPVSIPLPIIIYDSKRGLSFFSSSRFEHGHVAYNGYAIDHNHIIAVNEDGTKNEEASKAIFDFSITKNVTSLMISITIMLFVFISVARTYARNPDKAPTGLQSFIEPIIVFVRDDIAKASIGEKNYRRYMPFLLTVFFFIWINNLLGLVPIFPGGVNLTGNISITFTLAFMTFIITLISSNKNYWRHILAMPGVPTGILFILTPIEIMGMFLKPFVLMIRLFANITAGHIIALSFFSLIFIFGEMHWAAGLGVSLLSVAFTVFMTMLELLVAFLQAYVFALLSAMYFGMATEESH